MIAIALWIACVFGLTVLFGQVLKDSRFDGEQWFVVYIAVFCLIAGGVGGVIHKLIGFPTIT